MLVRNIVHQLTGSLEIRVSGPFTEKFLNLANRSGIYLWDIRANDRQVLARVSVRDFRDLRPIARTTRSRVRIVGRRGVPFQIVRLRRRAVWLLAGCLSLATVLVLSQFVWFIRIVGCDKTTPAEIEMAAAKAGLTRGVLRRAIDIPTLRQRMLLEMDQLSWVAI
ncbi:MAG: sporulation protein YqfD, partial [Chloroflexota bacterium]